MLIKFSVKRHLKKKIYMDNRSSTREYCHRRCFMELYCCWVFWVYRLYAKLKVLFNKLLDLKDRCTKEKCVVWTSCDRLWLPGLRCWYLFWKISWKIAENLPRAESFCAMQHISYNIEVRINQIFRPVNGKRCCKHHRGSPSSSRSLSQ